MDHLIERLKVAIPLIVITVLAFFLPGIYGKIAFTLLALALVLPTVHEACALLGVHPKTHYREALFAIIALIVLVPLLCCCAAPCKLILIDLTLLFLGFLAGILLLFRDGCDREAIANFAKFTLVEVLVCACLAPLPNLFHYPNNGPFLLFFLVLITKLGDIGAYAVGTLTAKLPGGNHKLAPTISPKKSWEGLAGGVAFAILGSLLCFGFARTHLTPFGPWAAILLGLLAGTIGLLGDLIESALKRAANAKDSGKLPGLGGVFDILDSLLLIGPIFYAFLLLCAK